MLVHFRPHLCSGYTDQYHFFLQKVKSSMITVIAVIRPNTFLLVSAFEPFISNLNDDCFNFTTRLSGSSRSRAEEKIGHCFEQLPGKLGFSASIDNYEILGIFIFSSSFWLSVRNFFYCGTSLFYCGTSLFYCGTSLFTVVLHFLLLYFTFLPLYFTLKNF